MCNHDCNQGRNCTCATPDKVPGDAVPCQNDTVNHPSHYTFSKYEVADVADEWYPHEPLLWNSNKYLARWDKKGDPIENLEKAIWYIQRKINQLKSCQR